MIFVEAGALCNVYEGIKIFCFTQFLANTFCSFLFIHLFFPLDLSLGGAFTAYCCGYKIHDPSGKNVKVMSKLTPDFCPVASYLPAGHQKCESSRAQIENSSCHGHVTVRVEMIITCTEQQIFCTLKNFVQCVRNETI